jgi:hypothetical protein
MLAACGRAATATAPSIPTDTPLPAATLTPTPSTPLAILVIPADMDQAASDRYQRTVYDLAGASGFRFQVRNTLTAADLADPTLKIAIVFPPDPGLATLAPAGAQVQILAVNIPGMTAGGNVSVLANDAEVDITAFIAGYIGAMITEDYHIAMLAQQGNPDATRAFNAFKNGMTFYCGLCQPFYFVNWSYPQYSEVPADKMATECGGYANQLLVAYKVYTVYFHGEAATAECMTYTGTQGAMIIGTTMPQPRPGGWVVTIQPDTIKAIQTAWPGLMTGQGGTQVQSPLGLADADPALLTEGKLRLAQQTLEALLAGQILTGNP